MAFSVGSPVPFDDLIQRHANQLPKKQARCTIFVHPSWKGRPERQEICTSSDMAVTKPFKCQPECL
jgi:hypothetical protein